MINGKIKLFSTPQPEFNIWKILKNIEDLSSTSTDICVYKNYVDAKLKELQWIQKKELFQKRVISKNTDFDVHTATVI